MPADTLNDMILGFSVILGTLLVYAFSLFLRIRKARRDQIHHQNHTPASE